MLFDSDIKKSRMRNFSTEIEHAPSLGNAENN